MSTSVTLYKMEEHLQALCDTVDMVDDPEQQEAILKDIAASYMAAVEKRDRMSHFLSHCESQQEGIDKEIKRLQSLKKAYSVTQERVESYVVRVIKDLGQDEKGKYRKLEGTICSFGIKKNPVSVEVRDIDMVPSPYKSITVTLPVDTWDDITGNLDIEQRVTVLAAVRNASVTADKKALRADIEVAAAKWTKNSLEAELAAGVPANIADATEEAYRFAIPGAQLVADKFSLVRK